VSRSPRQAQLRRLLRGCEVAPFAPGEADEVGALLDWAGSSDVVDAHLVVVAARGRAIAVTADLGDLRRLSEKLPEPITIRDLQGRGRRRPK